MVLPCGSMTSSEQPQHGHVWSIVVGAGSGARFGGMKQYETLGDTRVIDRSVSAARAVSDGVVVVVPAGDVEREGGIAGGASRSESVRNGLAQVPADADIVCVHDAARPFASTDLFEQVIAAVRNGADAAIPAVPVTDTIKIVASDGSGTVESTPDRSTLVAVQTPQAFAAVALRRAHELDDGTSTATDDAMLVERAGGVVVVVDGESSNRKITTQDDLEWARREVEQ
ncbi:MAG: 2-C-methyl-D-erythritol 4-phosphate cytidylyltransferase [Actinobacteria bacterium]|nr:2-C-methyl-D-erythritol 4-phosphate cytidylyltransferase [Actinomycetota bacterium]